MLFWIKRLIREAFDRGFDEGIGRGYKLGFLMGQIEERNKSFCTAQDKAFPARSLALNQAVVILWSKEEKEGEL